MKKYLIELSIFLPIWFIGCYVADYLMQPEARVYSMLIGMVTFIIADFVINVFWLAKAVKE